MTAMMESKDDIEKATFYITSISEEIGFVGIKSVEEGLKHIEIVTDFSVFLVRILSYKRCSSETFYICLQIYKRKLYISIFYAPSKKIFGGAFVFIEDPSEFNSDDISFICEAIKDITDRFAKEFNNRFSDCIFTIKKNKKKVTHTIKRKLDRHNFIETRLNIHNKKYEIKSSKEKVL